MWAEARSARRGARIGSPEQRRARGCHTRVDTATELPKEVDVDRAVGELRVQTADDVTARARELEVDTRPRCRQRGGHDDPRPGDADAHLQATALVRRSRWGRAHAGN